MTFGEKLHKLREQTGLTQEQLAERSGVNLWTLRGYEQGRREPSWKVALALAAALGVKAETFAECEEGTAETEDRRKVRKPPIRKARPAKPPARAPEARTPAQPVAEPSGQKKLARGQGRKRKG